jgi:MFS family permease
VFAIAGCFRPSDAGAAAAPMRAAIGEGLRWLAGHRLLRSLAVVVSVWHLVWAAGNAILVLYAQELLGLGSVGYGVLLAAGAVGSVLGTTLASRLASLVGRRSTLVGSVAVAGFAQMGFVLTSSPLVAGVLLAISGSCAVAWNVITVALRQRLAPDALLGRVNGAYRFAAIGSLAIGAALGGALGSIELRLPFAVAAVTLLLTAVGLLAATREPRSSRLLCFDPSPQASA